MKLVLECNTIASDKDVDMGNGRVPSARPIEYIDSLIDQLQKSIAIADSLLAIPDSIQCPASCVHCPGVSTHQLRSLPVQLAINPQPVQPDLSSQSSFDVGWSPDSSPTGIHIVKCHSAAKDI